MPDPLPEYSEQFRYMPIDPSRLFHLLYQTQDNQIDLADTKASLVLGANTILAAASALDRDGIHDILRNSGATTLEIVSVVLAIGVVGALLSSVMFALLTSFPRLGRVEQPTGTQTATNLYYFGDIASLSQHEFTNLYLNLTPIEIKTAILHQIHARAGIIQHKFHYLKYSILSLTSGIGLWVLLQISLVWGP